MCGAVGKRLFLTPLGCEHQHVNTIVVLEGGLGLVLVSEAASVPARQSGMLPNSVLGGNRCVSPT